MRQVLGRAAPRALRRSGDGSAAPDDYLAPLQLKRNLRLLCFTEPSASHPAQFLWYLLAVDVNK